MKINKNILILIQTIFALTLLIYSKNSFCKFKVDQYNNTYEVSSDSNTPVQLIDFKPVDENNNPISGNIVNLADCFNVGGKEGSPFCLITFIMDDQHSDENKVPVHVIIIYKNLSISSNSFEEMINLQSIPGNNDSHTLAGGNLLYTLAKAGLTATSVGLPYNPYADKIFMYLGGNVINGLITQGVSAGFSYLFFDTIIANIPKPTNNSYTDLLNLFEPFITHALLGIIKCSGWAKDQTGFHSARYVYCIIATSSAGGIASTIANRITDANDPMGFIGNFGIAAAIRVSLKGLTGVYPGGIGTTEQWTEIGQDIISARAYQEKNSSSS